VRRALWGLAALVAYVAVAVWMPGSPSRPLFDAVGPPQPYKWVNPPPEFASGNQKPESVSHDVVLGPSGSDAASVATGDGQAAIVLREGTFAARSGQKAVVMKIDPLDPAPIGPPPQGLRYDGNAYRFTATYKQSGQDATLTQEATVVLQFPIVATTLLRLDGSTWTDLKANPVSVSLQIFSKTDKLGVFTAAGPPLDTRSPAKKKFPAALAISLGAAVAAVVAGLIARTRARKHRRDAPKEKGRRSS